MRKCKIDKHIELGLYDQPIINFQGPKSKGASRGMYVKILFVVYNDGKIQLQRQLFHTCHPFFRSALFSFKLATFFCPGATFNVRPLVSSVKDKNFPCTSFLTKLYLKIYEYCNANELVQFYEKPP